MKKKTIFKLLSILLIVVLVFGLSACGKKEETGKETESKVTQETTKSSSGTKKDPSGTKETTTASVKDSETTTASDGSSSGGNGSTPGGSSSGGSSSGGSSQPATQPPTEPPTQPPTEPPTQPPAPTWTVSVTVDGCEHGGVFASGTYTYYYQPTAFDVLVSTGLPYAGSSYYVSSINGLSEFDYGRMSGWLYSVNGYEPSVSCGDYYLNDGDYVYWHYHSGDTL